MRIRPAAESDAGALAAIYRHHVLHGFGTFEEIPPSASEMEQRRQAVVAYGLPYVVAEDAGCILGFAYAGPFRLRAAYRFTVEDSVYIAADAVGRGVGRAVLSAVLDACEALGVRQVMALVGDTGNAASIGLHTALGFEQLGVGRSLGYKHGRWIDVVWMQKSLNGGDATRPQTQGLALRGH